jgi:hypothetical protein
METLRDPDSVVDPAVAIRIRERILSRRAV